jgi:hypothetical protein
MPTAKCVTFVLHKNSHSDERKDQQVLSATPENCVGLSFKFSENGVYLMYNIYVLNQRFSGKTALWAYIKVRSMVSAHTT